MALFHNQKFLLPEFLLVPVQFKDPDQSLISE